MPTPMSDQEVIECVDWLRNQRGEQEMRDRTERWHRIFDMSEPSDMPEHVSRGDTRDQPSPFLIELVQDLQAERHAGQTSVTVIAKDRGVPQGTVDRIEKWIAMQIAKAQKRFQVQDEVGWHQLCSYAGVIDWAYGGVARDDDNWCIYTPDVLTSYFTVSTGGPQRPPMFGQRYEAMITDVQRNFAGTKGLNGMGEYRPTVGRNGKWDWQEITDDRPASSMSYGSKWGQLVTHYKLDDGAYRYHVVMHPGQQKEGFMLWYDENRGGVDENGMPAATTLVVPGLWTGQRQPKNRLVCGLLPGMQYTFILDYLTSLMASRIEQSTGDVLVEKTPEMVEALAAAGQLHLGATAAQVQHGNPSIVDVAGKPTLWERLPLPELKDLLAWWTVERDRWSNSLREISDPQQLSEINTNVYLPHAAARRQKMKPWNDAMDWAMYQVARFCINALQYGNKKAVTSYATGDEYYGPKRPMNPGDSATVTWDDVKDFDKRFILVIATSNISDEESYQRLVRHDDLVFRGYATKRQGIPIMWPDEQAQIDVLSEDEGYKMATQLLQPQVPTTVQKRIRLRGGMLIPLPGAVPPPVSPGSANVPQSYPTPTIPGVDSSSAPAVEPSPTSVPQLTGG